MGTESGKVLAELPPQYAKAIELIDAAHAQDPRLTDNPEGPATVPHELRYARKMTKWLEVRCPDASSVLQIACRAQHFQRWQIPRGQFPMGRPGYLTWRAKLKSLAASQTFDTLSAASIQPPISDSERQRVAALIRKENLSSDEEAQILEDVACLVFLDDQFDEFERKADMDEAKMVNILRKTWGKMSPPGRELALDMDLSDKAKELICKALEP